MLRCLKFQLVGWSSDPDGHILGQISHQHTSPKTPRPEPNHQEHQQRYKRKGIIKGKIQEKLKQEKQTNEIQNHSALFLRLCFIALVLVVSLYFLAQHHCNPFRFWIPLCSTSKARLKGNCLTPSGDFPIHPLLLAQKWTDALWKQSNRKVQMQSCNKRFWIIFFLKPFLGGWLHQTDFFTVFVQEPFASIRWKHDLMASTFTNYNTFQS